jgi:hypothetical protein
MMDASEAIETRTCDDDRVESIADVARILVKRKALLSFKGADLDALKPYIACAACLISLSNTLPPHRF